MKNYLAITLFLLTLLGYSQNTLSGLLKKYNSEAIPYITVEELKQTKNGAILLDTREREEYNVSHLKNAIYTGYNHFNLDSVEKHIPNKNNPIVVYCSLGVRSEKIGIKLKAAGYTNVKNLYGGSRQRQPHHSGSGRGQRESVAGLHRRAGKWRIQRR